MSLFNRVLDGMLEGSVVGSFTKIGFSAREKLFDWDDEQPDLAGQIVVVTGGTTGIGRATARALVGLGADVHVTSRDQTRADETAAELSATGHALDLGDIDSVVAFIDRMRLLRGGIDVLIHNAGALTDDRRVDDRGMELTLSSHLVRPYFITIELRSSLKVGARVLFMSSGGMYTQGLDVASIEMSTSNYRGAIAYARAKRGQVELVTHLAPQWAPDVVMHSVHPGWVATPGVDAGLPGFGKVMGPLLRDADQGADTMVWLASNGGGDAPVGSFWLDRHPRRTSYLPGTSADEVERQRLVDWLGEQVADYR